MPAASSKIPALATKHQARLADLFAGEADRLERLSFEEAGIFFDFSKTHLAAGLVDDLAALADQAGIKAAREALFAGEIVNVTEARAVEHSAERGQGNPESVQQAQHLHARMRALIDAIEDGALGEIRHILHLGIGGSALGPDLVIDALGRDAGRYDVAVVSNVDGAALEEALSRFDPAATLVVVASKTFTTIETLLNAQSALGWLADNGVDDPYGQLIALTADPDKAVEWGVDATRVLPFANSVGGRYSLWSSIGFTIALALGWDAFVAMLEGAAEMDRHFRFAETHRNAPMLAAFVDQLYAVGKGAETRAVFAYDERLRLLPSYLQQLEMESNGKRVTVDGQPVDVPTAPITWGGVGTDGQHAVFQLLHQGTHLVPVEFIAVVAPEHGLDFEHHHQLLVNCFAQGAALMAGRPNADDPARDYPGDRPSTTLLIDQLEPARLGALIAFYEHRVYANAVLLGINAYDQFGVELGKQIAKSIATEGAKGFDASTTNLIARAFGQAE